MIILTWIDSLLIPFLIQCHSSIAGSALDTYGNIEGPKYSHLCVPWDRGSGYLLPLIISIAAACLLAAYCYFLLKRKNSIRPVNAPLPNAAQSKLGDLVVRPREKLKGWRDCARLHDGVVFRGPLPLMRRKITFSHFLFDDRCLMSWVDHRICCYTS